MPVDAEGTPGQPGLPTARADPLPGPAAGGLYADPRPKDTVADPGFAQAVGLLGALFAELGADLPSSAGMELSWALAELEDYSELTPAHPVTPDLGGREVAAVVADLDHQLTVLAATSPDLATTLRYLRAHEHIHTALTDLTGQTDVTAAAPESAPDPQVPDVGG